jgi:hypothetical protein
MMPQPCPGIGSGPDIRPADITDTDFCRVSMVLTHRDHA